MPIDSAVPQELRVDARQIGGRGLAADSSLWRTLFPIDHLRIDGRVAVGSSAQYLLASRLNSAKELIAVAWKPVSDADMAVLKTLKMFLINKECVHTFHFRFLLSLTLRSERIGQAPRADIPMGLEGPRVGPRALRRAPTQRSRAP